MFFVSHIQKYGFENVKMQRNEYSWGKKYVGLQAKVLGQKLTIYVVLNIHLGILDQGNLRFQKCKWQKDGIVGV